VIASACKFVVINIFLKDVVKESFTIIFISDGNKRLRRAIKVTCILEGEITQVPLSSSWFGFKGPFRHQLAVWTLCRRGVSRRKKFNCKSICILMIFKRNTYNRKKLSFCWLATPENGSMLDLTSVPNYFLRMELTHPLGASSDLSFKVKGPVDTGILVVIHSLSLRKGVPLIGPTECYEYIKVGRPHGVIRNS